MRKPRVFIGSSSEGFSVAEEIFSCMSRDTEPTLWTHGIFTPSTYPMEALEQAARDHSFAVLTASPDDETIKRGVSSATMRDNLLVEFGLFAGAFGRNRVFFVCADSPKLDMPSDLLGISVAMYDSSRAKGPRSDRAASVHSACLSIRNSIADEWTRIQRLESEREEKIRASKRSQSIRRLHTVAVRLRDVLFVLQRDSLAAFSSRLAFEAVKSRGAQEVQRVAQEFDKDAEAIGAQVELNRLASATQAALINLPFPEELLLASENVVQKTVDVGLDALRNYLSGDDPLRNVKREAGGRLSSLSKRYADWWDQHSRGLQETTNALQDRLFDTMVSISGERRGAEGE